MVTRRRLWLAWSVCIALLAALPMWAQDDEALGFERTPPRLSLTDGEVSFWREGAEEWTPARRNIALAPGDELWTGAGANLELQIGARTYLRAGEETQVGLNSLEPDYIQLRVTTGRVSLDMRSRRSGETIEIATPNAAFSIGHTGYYRLEVDRKTTSLISRRGGRVTVTTATGETATLAPSEEVVVTGIDAPQMETYAAPELDAWDRWNYERTDAQLDAVSARYASSGVYGLDDLDHHGDWRVVPTYGAVWVPRGIAVGWVPYSTGRWMWDRYYGWTWIDDAVWGWAPYHHGRWVYVSGFWGWAPGPIVVRPYYAPALVAFFGVGEASFSLRFGPPYLGWVALGWGEPVVPWWGPVGCRGVPRWAGWRGPRIVNNVVVTNTTVVHAREINVYQNARAQGAIVAVDRKQFGRRPVAEARVAGRRVEKVAPLHDLDVKPDRRSFTAATGRASRPPAEASSRPVVATRAMREERGSEAGRAAPPARVVTPKRGERDTLSERPPFGRQGDVERRAPPQAPSYRDAERASQRILERPSPEAGETPADRAARPPRPQSPERSGSRAERPSAPARPSEARGPSQDLPGEPANRVFQPRPDRGRGGSAERAGSAPAPRDDSQRGRGREHR